MTVQYPSVQYVVDEVNRYAQYIS